MQLLEIGILAALAPLYHVLIPPRWRKGSLLLISIGFIFRITPTTEQIFGFPNLVLPIATVLLAITAWVSIQPSMIKSLPEEDKRTLGIIGITIVIVGIWMLWKDELPVTFFGILILLLVFGLISIAANYHGAGFSIQSTVQYLLIVIILILFVVLKRPPINQTVAMLWEDTWAVLHKSPTIYSGARLSWVGYSYVAFRLVHVIREGQKGNLPELSLSELTTYVLFFPAYTAGPIDRVERFVADFRALPDFTRLSSKMFFRGGYRVFVGLFKKYVLADILALFSMTELLRYPDVSTVGVWFYLYAYGFRIYFDFSGYTDIAIGLGTLYGINLPENFDKPYLKPDIAAFWRSWHMTLTNWVRIYVFSPMSRFMRIRGRQLPTWLIVFTAQMTTMIVIGLWHGITPTLAIWGAWHGFGLFVHRLWSENTRRFHRQLGTYPFWQKIWAVGGTLITFNYVTIGWTWFVMDESDKALRLFLMLFGVKE